MNVLFIGMGYVGTTMGLVLANKGHTVTGLDINKEKIDTLNKGEVYFYEPGLQEMLATELNKRIFFTTNAKEAVEENDLIFITVGTPSLDDGSADLIYVKEAAKLIRKYRNSEKVVIVKSTVPIGTTEKVHEWINQNGDKKPLVKTVMNPEFLREGSALDDALNPDRIVIGSNDVHAASQMNKLYQNWSCPFLHTTPKAAEMIKYASNSFLATKISFINEIAKLCDTIDVNIQDVSKGMGLDDRIGPQFLQAGLGYGGSCFPKDVRELLVTADQNQMPLEILKKVDEVNKNQANYFIGKIKKRIPSLKKKKVVVYGLSFKPNTDDIRESVSYSILEQLIEEKAEIVVHDPIVKLSSQWLNKGVVQCDDAYEAAKCAEVILICTDWNHYKNLDWLKVRNVVSNPVIFDGRNTLNGEDIKKYQFHYEGIGFC
ncbi:nucleotide sugar dehydrogenase [Salipaludibacillus keqinensis]|uniref:UDP-glucose 6-dehydrogenase n=1 Tax=Salipaludibacillus keqinensis TaxID=2045207 RepID=A0A323TJL5_9BACI|nr:UDP-glucose/GDP-mannose dehydrogenase family protein [Salipaludibacillus keqinensis]PYZ92853.1 nucleotide sugar dehydrogenase [Salipaludibacillus keqinensis]